MVDLWQSQGVHPLLRGLCLNWLLLSALSSQPLNQDVSTFLFPTSIILTKFLWNICGHKSETIRHMGLKIFMGDKTNTIIAHPSISIVTANFICQKSSYINKSTINSCCYSSLFFYGIVYQYNSSSCKKLYSAMLKIHNGTIIIVIAAWRSCTKGIW